MTLTPEQKEKIMNNVSERLSCPVDGWIMCAIIEETEAELSKANDHHEGELQAEYITGYKQTISIAKKFYFYGIEDGKLEEQGLFKIPRKNLTQAIRAEMKINELSKANDRKHIALWHPETKDLETILAQANEMHNQMLAISVDLANISDKIKTAYQKGCLDAIEEIEKNGILIHCCDLHSDNIKECWKIGDNGIVISKKKLASMKGD